MISIRIISGLTLATLLFAAGPADAVNLGPTSGFLPTYTGPTGEDLDVTSASAVFTGGNFELDATFGAPIGTTLPSGGNAPTYVWGIYRGSPTPASFAPTYPGVIFDAVVVSIPSANVALVIDIANGGTTTPFSGVTVSGNSLDITVPEALLPSLGLLTPGQYGVNLWPRFGVGPGIDQIAQFVPSNSINIIGVPEPGVWAMLLTGFLALGTALRMARRPGLAV
ncbi:MAG TPA: hypothetical protein VGU69_01155 [Rhizomicrobium sp.]|nr:hypothetical protein [Rhizomicrobium sp.]